MFRTVVVQWNRRAGCQRRYSGNRHAIEFDLCDAAVESSGPYPVPLAQKILLTVLRVLPRMEHPMSLRKSLATLADHSP